jgi:hypothetical protein
MPGDSPAHLFVMGLARSDKELFICRHAVSQFKRVPALAASASAGYEYNFIHFQRHVLQ